MTIYFKKVKTATIRWRSVVEVEGRLVFILIDQV